jgi:diaminopimelate epimerase
VRFTKGHGTGNDFVLLPDPDADLDLSPGLVQALCDRRHGLGADGVLRVVLTAAVPELAARAGQARWFMDYRNADGSSAQMCGNGIRVYARYLVTCGYAAAGPMAILTRAGVRGVVVGEDPRGDITVDMGAPRLVEGPPRTVGYRGRRWPGTEVWMGNPHVVVDLGDGLDEMGDERGSGAGSSGAAGAGGAGSDAGGSGAGPLAGLGPVLDRPSVAPELDTNVEFVQVHRPGRLSMRVHERGVGETRSCGTGACAAAVAEAHWRGAGGTDSQVDVPGGRLHVRWEAGGAVTLSGPAELVAHGVLDESWLAANG